MQNPCKTLMKFFVWDAMSIQNTRKRIWNCASCRITYCNVIYEKMTEYV